jgi:hypothetical protein
MSRTQVTPIRIWWGRCSLSGLLWRVALRRLLLVRPGRRLIELLVELPRWRLIVKLPWRGRLAILSGRGRLAILPRGWTIVRILRRRITACILSIRIRRSRRAAPALTLRWLIVHSLATRRRWVLLLLLRPLFGATSQ